jgi:hypothetical protein
MRKSNIPPRYTFSLYLFDEERQGVELESLPLLLAIINMPNQSAKDERTLEPRTSRGHV